MDKSSSTALFCFSFSHCFVSRFLEIQVLKRRTWVHINLANYGEPSSKWFDISTINPTVSLGITCYKPAELT